MTKNPQEGLIACSFCNDSKFAAVDTSCLSAEVLCCLNCLIAGSALGITVLAAEKSFERYLLDTLSKSYYQKINNMQISTRADEQQLD